jgi:hypothetical protein
MRARASCAAALGSALLIATPATASHSHPATYTGGVVGGSLEFDVSADGTAITRLKIVSVSECARHDVEIVSPIAIVDHAFDHSTPGLWFRGSFTSPRAAQGTVRYHEDFPDCTSSLRAWSATTTGASPAPAPTPVPAPPDRTAPRVMLAGATTQRPGATIAVSVTSNELGTAGARGTVSVRRPGRKAARYALRPAAARLTPLVRARLTLRVPRTARKSIRRALRDGRRVSAAVKVSVRDGAGNRTSRSRTIRLR